MTSSVAALLIVAFVAANLPFILSRPLGVLARPRKVFGWHLLELVLMFGLTALLAFWLEGRQSPPHAQNWQFWVTNLALFLVFAFPGFVGRDNPHSSTSTLIFHDKLRFAGFQNCKTGWFLLIHGANVSFCRNISASFQNEAQITT